MRPASVADSRETGKHYRRFTGKPGARVLLDTPAGVPASSRLRTRLRTARSDQPTTSQASQYEREFAVTFGGKANLVCRNYLIENGASEGIRTLDIHLGKVTLYQTELRSLPSKRDGNYGNRPRLAR